MIFKRRQISFRSFAVGKFFDNRGNKGSVFILNSNESIAYILSKLGFLCLLFEQIIVRSFLPIKASNMLGGGKVGVSYSGNRKPYPNAWLTSLPSTG